MSKQQVIFQDLGKMDYKTAWDYQEKLLQENVRRKSEVWRQETGVRSQKSEIQDQLLIQISLIS